MIQHRVSPSLLLHWFLILMLGASLAVPAEAAQRRSKARSASRSKPRTTSKAKRQPAARPGTPKTLQEWAEQIRLLEDRQNERWSVSVQDLATTAVIFSHQADRRLVPASNRKLITLGMALESLGPAYRFTTEFGLTGPIPPSRAHYHGNLVLRSAGDPSFDPLYMEGRENPLSLYKDWAKGLSALGVSYIHGDLIVDASAFGEDQDHYPEEWDETHRNLAYAPIPAAFALGQNLLRVSVRSGGKSGRPGEVEIFPSVEGIQINNRTRTGVGGGAVSVAFENEGLNQLNVSGKVGSRGEDVALLPVPQPLEYVASQFQRALKQQGIEILGQARVLRSWPAGQQPIVITQRIGYHQSPTLDVFLTQMMRRSDNFLAEQIWRSAAAKMVGNGSVMNARQAEQRWYSVMGLPWIEPGWDGSGLSRKDLNSASELVAIFRHTYNSAYRDFLLDSLPLSGRRGTLRGRSMGNESGRVYAKTGTLSGVSSLTGAICDENGTPRWAFSIIGNANHNTNGRLLTRIDQLLGILIRQMDSEKQLVVSSPPAVY